MTTRPIGRTLTLACTALALAACDESSPTLNADNAVSAAACALSPLDFVDLLALAEVIHLQTSASCTKGGVLLRSESSDSVRIQADHCVLANDTTLRGVFTETYLGSSPTRAAWQFDEISSTVHGDGTRLDGRVVLQQTDTRTSLSFDALTIDHLEGDEQESAWYGASEQHIEQSADRRITSTEYRTRIDRCGREGFALDTATPTPLTQHDTDFFPRAGEVQARAGDGSRLRILIDGDQLTLRVDSNADQVDDTQLAMSWAAFNLATARSRARAAGAPPTLWPLPRLRPGPTWESPATSPTPP